MKSFLIAAIVAQTCLQKRNLESGVLGASRVKFEDRQAVAVIP